MTDSLQKSETPRQRLSDELLYRALEAGLKARADDEGSYPSEHGVMFHVAEAMRAVILPELGDWDARS